jgi:uncharacterized protein
LINVLLRLYEELNDVLPADNRKRDFAVAAPERSSVAEVLRQVGVPLNLVDLVLVDNQPVPLSHAASDGERISAYPVFERFDITGVTRVRPAPLRRTRFITECSLARLAVYLRMLGFDTRLMVSRTDAVTQGERERRIFLTREYRPHGIKTSRIFVVRHSDAREQLREVSRSLDLGRSARPMTRCPACNRRFRKPAGAGLAVECASCGRSYPTAHLVRMRRHIRRITAAEDAAALAT